MPQSLAKLHVHLVFSTKHRERVLPVTLRPELHAYLGGCLNQLECHPVEINSEPDHVHLLFILGRTVCLSEVVGQVKRSSTEWLRRRSSDLRGFHWQAGYGAFSVSQSQIEATQRYIRNQQEHHAVKSFQDELRAFLRAHEVAFDERYVWD